MLITSSTRFRLVSSFLLLASLISWLEYSIVSSATFQIQPDRLAGAVAFDLLIGIPLLYYLLVVYLLSVTPITLVAVSVAAVGLASWILPPAHHQYIRLAERLLIIGELGVLVIMIRNLRKIVAVYRHLNALQPDFIGNLELSLKQVVGRIPGSKWLVGEISILRYALLGPWVKVERKVEQRDYSSYRESGVTALGIILLVVSGIETLAVHLLVIRWQKMMAWVLFGLSLYSMLVVIGYLVSLRKRPILVADGWLRIRVGFLWRADIPIADIHQVKRVGFIETNEVFDDLAKMVGSSPNVLIRLSKPVELRSLYRRDRPTQMLGLFVDDADSFVKAVNTL